MFKLIGLQTYGPHNSIIHLFSIKLKYMIELLEHVICHFPKKLILCIMLKFFKLDEIVYTIKDMYC